MDSAEYLFVIRTQQGCMIGNLNVIVENSVIYGDILIDNDSTQYQGTIDRDGNFQVFAELTISKKVFSCTGTGKVSLHSIHITFVSEEVSFSEVFVWRLFFAYCTSKFKVLNFL